MKNIRLLPVVIMAVAALLLLKTLGLVGNGSYVLTGVSRAEAAGGSSAGSSAGGSTSNVMADDTPTLPGEPTMEDSTPTLADPSPTMKPQSEAAGHAAPAADAHAGAGEEPAADGHADPAAVAEAENGATTASGTYCVESDAAITADGAVVINPASAGAPEQPSDSEPEVRPRRGDPMPIFAESMADCLPSGDAVPLLIDGIGGSVPLLSTDSTTDTEQALLQRLAARRDELQKYENDLALRASIVDAAERRIEERAATLSALEAQISTLVDQRQEMETGQFAGIVAMYETMKAKDAAGIFNNLDMNVLLRVAKTMSPRKMAPILAEMDTARAQELTVKMAALADRPATEMTPDDLAALPQIVGQ